MAVLVADLGNTNVKVGIYDGAHLVCRKVFPSACLDSPEQVLPLLSSLLADSALAIQRVVAGSVTPQRNALLESAIANLLNCPVRWIRYQHPDFLPSDVAHPERVGIDRLINCWMAMQLYPAPLVVFDIGSAMTVDLLDSRGHFVGGLIIPGPELAAETLSGRTALLPKVTPDKPARLWGDDTVSAISSGIYWGWLEMIRGLIRRYQSEWNGDARIILTGGGAGLFQTDLSDLLTAWEPDLSLTALAKIDEAYPWSSCSLE